MSSPVTDLRRIRELERKAHQGELGAWRKEYLQQYRQVLEHIFEEIRVETRHYINSSPEGITCRKGCAHCCEHFVSISLSHALLIVDYLYTREKLLTQFLRKYNRWLRSIEDNPQSAAVFSRLEEHTTFAAVVKPYSQELLSGYHAFSIPCPFLDGGQCSIYPIRPVCCAVYFSMSPPDYCRSDNAIPATTLTLPPSQVNLRRLAGLADPRFSLHQESLPKLVYKLLTLGLPEIVLELQKLFNAQEQDNPFS
jgi:Fe-S-cluster containining protein